MLQTKTLVFLSLISALPQVAAETIFKEDFSIGLYGQFTAFSTSSDKNWYYDTYNGTSSAAMNGYAGSTDSNDWLISKTIDLTSTKIQAASLSFTSRVRFDGQNISVKVATDYQQDLTPDLATWQTLSPVLPNDGQGSSGSNFEPSGNIDLTQFVGQEINIAFHYQTAADVNGNNGSWYIDDIIVDVQGNELELPLTAAMAVNNTELQLYQEIEFKALAYNGLGEPYSYLWDLGDGTQKSGSEITHSYAQGGNFTAKLTVTDNSGTDSSLQLSKQIIVEAPNPYIVKTKQSDQSIRFASFNVSMEAENYTSEDIETKQSQILENELASGNNSQIKNIAEIIQLVRPDVLLLNEFDYIADENLGVKMFINQYLNIPQSDQAQSIDYPYYYLATSNTGEATEFDLNNDGNFGSIKDDAYGYGRFPGHYGMVLLSRYPIEASEVRSFQKFLWKDMPNNLMPIDPSTQEAWYNQAETEVFRLSSKSHWDVPVKINDKTIHILASHPTPPTFDGDEDRNGRRNHDEIRLWADYVSANNSSYIYDDNGRYGGLKQNERSVILGDLNASIEGDAYPGTINQLLLHPNVYGEYAPSSEGGIANAPSNPISAHHTASWRMRADYVLAARTGLNVTQGSVFWPTSDQDLYRLVKSRAASSDHRLVWLDIEITEIDSIQDDADTGGSINILLIFLTLATARFRQTNHRSQ